MQVFDNDDFPPDAEFGCFQMVNGLPDTDFADEALLRLDVGEASCKHTLSYAWAQSRLVLLWSNTSVKLQHVCHASGRYAFGAFRKGSCRPQALCVTILHAACITLCCLAISVPCASEVWKEA